MSSLCAVHGLAASEDGTCVLCRRGPRRRGAILVGAVGGVVIVAILAMTVVRLRALHTAGLAARAAASAALEEGDPLPSIDVPTVDIAAPGAPVPRAGGSDPRPGSCDHRGFDGWLRETYGVTASAYDRAVLHRDATASKTTGPDRTLAEDQVRRGAVTVAKFARGSDGSLSVELDQHGVESRRRGYNCEAPNPVSAPLPTAPLPVVVPTTPPPPRPRRR